jgi:uroporphyrinogen-III synthase
MTHVALSEHVAAPLRHIGLATLVAANPDEEHLLSLLSIQLRKKTP